MKPTRREFIVASSAAVCAVSLGGVQLGAATLSPTSAVEPFLLEGDPYTAHVDEHGLGGRSWDGAFAHAQRFRGTADDRDRFVLGLEI